ncbi:uncharacterized protein LOC100679358 isoform X1 [Nasonia vitripennis]|uniref:PCFS4-like zinc finger domain-containing protein n=1 Tax=Nasonia vitripennis TaxID=7425 RepID=A0A7M7IRA1_NASVI|nr:uncharacterized protein LOC100679358 isoform X1 [Nasonia vitripennis]
MAAKRSSSASLDSAYSKKAKFEKFDELRHRLIANQQFGKENVDLLDYQDENKDPLKDSKFPRKSTRYPFNNRRANKRRNRNRHLVSSIQVWEHDVSDRTKNFGNNLYNRKDHPGTRQNFWHQSFSRDELSFHPYRELDAARNRVISWDDYRMWSNELTRFDYGELPFYPNLDFCGVTNTLSWHDHRRTFNEPTNFNFNHMQTVDAMHQTTFEPSNARSQVMPLDTTSPYGTPHQVEPVKSSPALAAPAQASNLDPMELFEKLVEYGIVPKPNTEEKKPEEETRNDLMEKMFDTFFQPGTEQYLCLLRCTQNPAALMELHSGKQCGECGVRFQMKREETDSFKNHLDWHFRQNRKRKYCWAQNDTLNSRPWYCRKNDWIQLDKIGDFENIRETEMMLMMDAKKQEPSVPIMNFDDDAICNLCKESFEQFFNDSDDEWHVRPAVAFEGQNYHPRCLEDYKRELERPVSTPCISKKEEKIEGNCEKNEIEDTSDEKNEDGTAEEKAPHDASPIFENVELTEESVTVTVIPVIPSIPVPPSKFQTNCATNISTASNKTDEWKKENKMLAESPLEVEPMKLLLVPASVKPSLQGKKLTKHPAVEKGAELTGLCSVM